MEEKNVHVVLASEEVTRRNVLTAVAHGNETRKLFRELEVKMQYLQDLVLAKEKDAVLLKKQVAILLQNLV